MKREKNVTEYSYRDENGDAHATVYCLFPGIELAYITAHMSEFDFETFEKGFCKNYAIIHYCREGRLEQAREQEFSCLMPGDCSVHIQDRHKTRFRLPMKHYRGICIGMDFDEAKSPVIAFCENCGYAPNEIVEHICGEMPHKVLHSSESIRNFFDALYEVNDEQRLDYLRMKLPELFYKMKHLSPDNCSEVRSPVPRTQVDFVKLVAHYISENINEKITVNRLTQEFGVSDSYLQNAFRNVYGMPVISFIRVQKMQCAAQVLIGTPQTINEIAEKFGYENESKFSAAFKKIMGDSPGVFRKEHSKVKII